MSNDEKRYFLNNKFTDDEIFTFHEAYVIADVDNLGILPSQVQTTIRSLGESF